MVSNKRSRNDKLFIKIYTKIDRNDLMKNTIFNEMDFQKED